MAEGSQYSAKGILCNMIQDQRYNLMSISSNITSRYMRGGPDYAPARNAALLARYPTIADLREELRNSREEVAVLVENMPEDFVEQKGNYFYRQQALSYSGIYPRRLLGEMKEVLEAAHMVPA